MPDQSEIEQDDLAIGTEHDIAGMRVNMELAVKVDHGVEDVLEPGSKRGARVAGVRCFLPRRPFHVLHDQDVFSAEGIKRARDSEIGMITKVPCDLRLALRLLPHVALTSQERPQLRKIAWNTVFTHGRKQQVREPKQLRKQP